MPYEDRCFACGLNNPHGLQLRFRQVDDRVEATITLGLRFEGPPGTVHGGIVATLLDEAIAHAAWRTFGLATTGELTVRFRQAAPLHVPLHITGWVEKKRLGLVVGGSRVTLGDGTVIATAQGKFMSSSPLP